MNLPAYLTHIKSIKNYYNLDIIQICLRPGYSNPFWEGHYLGMWRLDSSSTSVFSRIGMLPMKYEDVVTKDIDRSSYLTCHEQDSKIPLATRILFYTRDGAEQGLKNLVHHILKTER